MTMTTMTILRVLIIKVIRTVRIEFITRIPSHPHLHPPTPRVLCVKALITGQNIRNRSNIINDDEPNHHKTIVLNVMLHTWQDWLVNAAYMLTPSRLSHTLRTFYCCIRIRKQKSCKCKIIKVKKKHSNI
ncbi:uncharacterized protein LOC118746239 [Rhagoletis pomonella]|uniref:uncharacterized protein LOC118746239 n=1 Tax=Rhagoletis pomonella TaxID=28610 RepID=UPI00177AE4CA|nr:uncharacterized protein LOC118746239 [Rhagoletis pomonella]